MFLALLSGCVCPPISEPLENRHRFLTLAGRRKTLAVTSKPLV